MANTYIGIDPSWTALAVTALESSSDGLCVGKVQVLRTKPSQFQSQPERLNAIGRSFTDIIQICSPEMVAIEGYAIGAKYQREMAGELGGHLRWLLWKMGTPFISVPPLCLKQYVTGKGSGQKEQMLMHTYRRWGYEAPNSDACDAYGLARMAHEYCQGEHTARFEKLVGKFEVVEPRALEAAE